MRKIILIALSLFFVEIINAQVDNKKHIEKIIDVFYKVDTSNLILKNVLPRYAKLDTSDILYELIYENYNYSYTLLNYSLKYPPHEIKIQSLEEIENVINRLKEEFSDKLFSNRDFMFALDYYLKFKTDNKIGERDSIELNKLIDIASKYYYVYKIENDSSIKFSFCGGGANPFLKQPELSTHIIAESFAFNALGQLLIKRDFSLIRKMKNEIEPMLLDTLRRLESEITYEKKLALLRQITWNEMKKDERIKDALLEAGEQSKNIIPLKIIY